MTVTTQQLVDLVAQVLIGATDAGQNVYTARTWPTRNNQYPLIKVNFAEERKESQGLGAVQFTVTGTVRVTAIVSAPGLMDDDGAVAVEAALTVIARQIEVAVINNPAIMPLLSQYPSVETELKVTADAQVPTGEIQLLIAMQFYQGPEDFWQPSPTPLTTVVIDADLQNIYDPTGTYTGQPFPYTVNPAPRTSGPDGRSEGLVKLTFPQE